MKKLSVTLTFGFDGDQKPYTKEFDVEDDFDLKHSEYLSKQIFDECHIDLLSTTYRAALPAFGAFTSNMNWFTPQTGAGDLTRWAAHQNTAETWWQIENSFTEAAYLLSRARAYEDIENAESDNDRRMYLHLMKIQHLNAAAYLTSKIEDWFFLLLFVNSGGSLISSIDVQGNDWLKEVTRGAIYKGLKARKSHLCCARFRRSDPYLDALSDEEYRTIRSVFKRLGRPRAVRTIRNYRNEIAHRGLPAVDVAVFSPAFKFPKKHGNAMSLSMPAAAPIDYKFLDLYQAAVDALKHMETELLRLKQIPVLMPQ